MLVQDETSWDERAVERLHTELKEQTTMTVIRLPQLRAMIKDVYAAAATAPTQLAARHTSGTVARGQSETAPRTGDA
ncbi:hypothetical protein [Nonomuraea sp. bgisy101]|uniref:hypothetical protein n=1 Tax=Nonomuraea sp. bgisy101 TaxID=3413784 RepID=UPI003D731322